MDLKKLIATAPDSKAAERYLEALKETYGESTFRKLCSSPNLKELIRVLGFSPYAASVLIRNMEALQPFLEKEPLRPPNPKGLLKELNLALQKERDFRNAALILRAVKQREVLKVLALDLSGGSLTSTVRRLTHLAEVLVRAGLSFCVKLFGVPERDILVLAFGKFGGRELNYASDIDLAYFHAPGVEKVRVIKLLETFTRLMDGLFEGERVWRVDLRLRPGGKEGEISLSLPAARQYYLYRIHPFERLALIRARPVAGNIPLGYALLRSLRPVVFPRYLDYTYLEHVRDLKERIRRETVRRGIEDDLKIGKGGIREVEFLVQALQSIYGGKHPGLRGRGVIPNLRRLARLNVIPASEARELEEAYVFLRMVEHRIQSRYFQQTARLPREPLAITVIARSLRFENSESFLNHLETIRKRVSSKFEAFLSPACPKEKSELVKRLEESLLSDEPLKETSQCTGVPENLLEDLRSLIKAKGPLSTKKTALLKALLPQILDTLLVLPEKDKALSRLITFFERLGGRLSLLQAFKEKPSKLERLIKLISISEFLWRLLEAHPELAEALFEPQIEPQEDLFLRRLNHLPYDEALSTLRTLKNELLVETALLDLDGRIPIETVLSRLTVTAELFVHFTHQITLRRLSEEWGRSFPGAFAIFGLGKLGAREMGYRSDLDLVFVYEGPPEATALSAKLAQRFLFYLSLRLPGGEGYPVDARLRPEGRKGPLTVPLSGFLHYYREEADLWELVAATRLRFLCGDTALGKKVTSEVRKIIARKAIDRQFLQELYRMRLYMEKERGREDSEHFNPKLGYGGLADLEFLAAIQAIQLLKEQPEFEETNTLAILQTMSENRVLVQNYLFLREVEQKLILLYHPKEEDPRYPKKLLGSLEPWLGKEVRERYENVVRENRKIFEAYFHRRNT